MNVEHGSFAFGTQMWVLFAAVNKKKAILAGFFD